MVKGEVSISSRTQLITQNSGLQALSSKESAKNQCVINSVQLLTIFVLDPPSQLSISALSLEQPGFGYDIDGRTPVMDFISPDSGDIKSICLTSKKYQIFLELLLAKTIWLEIKFLQHKQTSHSK